MDRFPADLSYCLHLLIGFDGVEVDHGGRLPAMGGVRPLEVVEGDPGPDASLGLRPVLRATQIGQLGLLGGVATVQAIESLCNLRPILKWPYP